MAACWPLDLPPSPKVVLVSLADNANDHGECWPAIATICRRTSLGKTAVIEAIKYLEAAGYLHADRSNGRRTSYVITVGQTSLFDPKPVRLADRFAKQTGPAGDANRSASRTKPVRQADTNRQEPSGTLVCVGAGASETAEPTAANHLAFELADLGHPVSASDPAVIDAAAEGATVEQLRALAVRYPDKPGAYLATAAANQCRDQRAKAERPKSQRAPGAPKPAAPSVAGHSPDIPDTPERRIAAATAYWREAAARGTATQEEAERQIALVRAKYEDRAA